MHSDRFLFALMNQTGGRPNRPRAGPPQRWLETACAPKPSTARRLLGRLRGQRVQSPQATQFLDYADPLGYLEMEFAVGFAHEEERRP
ncbi:MAG: hypothetical protein ACRDMJ_00145 [Solirubrobacteraceae bacterium]